MAATTLPPRDGVRPADCRTCPTLRNLFPTSPSSFSPISPFFSSSSFAFWDQTRLPAVRITRLPPSSSSFRQLQLFQWTDHTVFFTSFTPSVNAPGDQQAEARGASTFHHGGLFGVYSQLTSPPSLAAALGFSLCLVQLPAVSKRN